MLLSLCCSVVIMLYCYCVALLFFVLSYVLIVCTVPLPPGVNPIAVDKYININIKKSEEENMGGYVTNTGNMEYGNNIFDWNPHWKQILGGVINSTDETGKKLLQITSARRSVSGPGARLHSICFFGFLGTTVVCRLYKLTPTDQAQVTLQFRLSLSDFVYIFLVGLPFWGGGAYFFAGVQIRSRRLRSYGLYIKTGYHNKKTTLGYSALT